MVTDNDRWELSPDTTAEYLRQQGVVPAGARADARVLGGGVSNHVIEVRWDTDCLVVKQPLPNLAVAEDWPADMQRVHNEAAAARGYASVLNAAGLDVRVPDIRFEAKDDYVIALECAPDNAVMWKRELLDGHVDADVARIVGDALATVQTVAAGDEALRERFASKKPFDQLRLDPYHRSTAERHPDVADAILTEADRIANVERTLVHGDYSPKNVLVDRSNGLVPWILDFEVAHWGDPAFDPAFMLNHLSIKSVYNHAKHAAYIDAARSFWDAYQAKVEWDVEAETVVELGVLMLARVDGKSPVEYVSEGPIAETLRTIAKQTLTGSVETMDDWIDLLHQETATL